MIDFFPSCAIKSRRREIWDFALLKSMLCPYSLRRRHLRKLSVWKDLQTCNGIFGMVSAWGPQKPAVLITPATSDVSQLPVFAN